MARKISDYEQRWIDARSARLAAEEAALQKPVFDALVKLHRAEVELGEAVRGAGYASSAKVLGISRQAVRQRFKL
jgi:hypothetical protein